MSTLDDILRSLEQYLDPARADVMASETAKRQVKDLMLELIDSCSEREHSMFHGPMISEAELRKKVSEL